jgi:hypothetical protein
MSKLYWKFIVVLTLAFGSTAATASDQGPGRVSYVHVLNNGVVLFIMTAPRGTPPSCATSEPTRWAFNSTTAAGQAKLSVLLTAYASAKDVWIYGTGTCADKGDTETMDWFATQG